MIKIENTEVCGFEAAIRGMRNPMNSWEKSDSGHGCCDTLCEECGLYNSYRDCVSNFVVGDNDLELMRNLVNAGTDHSKFMRMINVTCDITAPLYWWKEFDTYKVGTVRNSCSTMHKIHDKEFSLDDFSHEQLCETVEDSLGTIVTTESETMLEITINCLNYLRERFMYTDDKRYWYQMIQLLPSSYNQRATVQMNYSVLRNMYHARKNHKLDEWRDFCKWIESLPYSELITMDRGEKDGKTV